MQRLGPHHGCKGVAQFFCFPDMGSLSILDCASESAQDIEFFLRNKHRNIEKQNKREREREEKPAEVLAN